MALTDVQAAALEDIRARLRADNLALWAVVNEYARLADARDAQAHDDQAERLRAAGAAASEARAQIRNNASVAAAQALAVLTDEQRAQLPVLLGR